MLRARGAVAHFHSRDEPVSDGKANSMLPAILFDLARPEECVNLLSEAAVVPAELQCHSI